MLSYIKSVSTNTVLYLTQFIIVPLFFAKYYPSSNEAFLIFLVLIIAASVVAVMIWNLKVRHLIVADIVYFLLIMVYSAKGAYGIGLRGISLDGLQAKYSHSEVLLGAAIAATVLVGTQLILIVCLKFITATRKNNKQQQ